MKYTIYKQKYINICVYLLTNDDLRTSKLDKTLTYCLLSRRQCICCASNCPNYAIK